MRASAPPSPPSATRSTSDAQVFIHLASRAPRGGHVRPEHFRLAPVAKRLSELLGKPVPLRKDWLDGVDCAPATRCCARTCASTRARRMTRSSSRAAWPRSATCSSWTLSAPHTAPRRARTAWRASRRLPALARCWSANSRRSSAPSRSRRGRWSRSSAARRFRPSSRCSSRCSSSVDQLIVGGGIANTFLAAQRRGRGQVAVREGHARRGAPAHGQGTRPRHRHSVADRRRGGHGVRRHRARGRACRE